MAHIEGELLLRSVQKNSLAARLGIAHTIHPAYLSRGADAVVVRRWLEENEMLRDAPDPEGTLRALASRSEDDELVRVGDDDLRLLHNAFLELDSATQQES